MVVKKPKVLVALSGGVDSGVAAAILAKEGYRCSAVHLKFWSQPSASGEAERENKCCTPSSLRAAKQTAALLGMPFLVLDFSTVFKKEVVDYFLSEYSAGRTPNPCIVCNQFIKFGQLLKYARVLGFDYLATGHYVRKVSLAGSCQMLEGKDLNKDQSYFLYRLGQEKLSKSLFPLGDLNKTEVRKLALKWNLPVARSKESQEICFVGNSLQSFLGKYLKKAVVVGQVVDANGDIIGKHKGLPFYTVGQRHGFTLNLKSQVTNSKLIPPFYVIGKNVKKNQLIVGFGKETERQQFLVEKLNWINKNPESSNKLLVRIRYQGKLLNCSFNKKSKDCLEVFLKEPVRGITPGQSAVFYTPFTLSGEKTNEVLGGGQIA